MNIHEIYVSLETAKMLKEAGFDWPCNHAICCDSTHYPNLKEGDVLEYNYLEYSELMEGKKPHMLLCPTLEVAQRWLREVHHLHITIFSSSQESWMFRITKPHQKLEEGVYGEDFYTYEEAQEAGIKAALELILKKGE